MERSNNRAIDHLDLVWHRLTVVQRIEDQVPKPCHRPTSELPINARPFAKFRWKIAPLRACTRDPENTIKDKAVVGCGPATSPPDAGDERLKEHPFCVFHQQSRQDSLPKSYLESDFK